MKSLSQQINETFNPTEQETTVAETKKITRKKLQFKKLCNLRAFWTSLL